MASIQTSFAIMPAAVYWFGGLALAHGSTAVSVPTARRVHDPADALFFPVGSLLGVGLDVQTSLALFEPDLRVPRPAGRHRREAGRLEEIEPGDVVFDDVWFTYATTTGRSRTSASRSTAGTHDRRSSARRGSGRRRSPT
jgi:ATP-binding cassette subfamily B protein